MNEQPGNNFITGDAFEVAPVDLEDKSKITAINNPEEKEIKEQEDESK